MRKCLAILFIAIFAFPFNAIPKKSRTSAGAKKEQEMVRSQIKKTEAQVKQVQADTEKQLTDLAALNGEINIINRKIASVKAEIAKIDAQRKTVADSVVILEDNIYKLKKLTAKYLVDSRRNRENLSEIGMVFSSKSFYQALKRSGRMRQANIKANERTKLLKQNIAELESYRQKLDSLNIEQSQLLATLSKDSATLKAKENETKNLVASLKKKGNELTRALQESRRKAKQLDEEITRLIAEEVRAAEEARKAEEARRAEEARKAEAARKAEEERRIQAEREAKEAEMSKKQVAENADKPNDKKSKKKEDKKKEDKKKKSDNKQKPENVAKQPDAPKVQDKAVASNIKSEPSVNLTGSFASNKGRLLFPVSGKYTILSYFGRNHHAELPNIEIENSGIDILASPQSDARAVFDGVVSMVVSLGGFHNVVMVRHGEYITVYSHIDKIAVKKGQKIKAGQKIGSIYNDEGRNVLHFEVRRETAKLNPLQWVRK